MKSKTIVSLKSLGKWLVLPLFLISCTRIFGWEIHAPGVLSSSFYDQISPAKKRLALYLPEHLVSYVSKEKGGKMADPQLYYVGEAFAPILLEAFQHGFDEFVFLEVEPTAALLQQYQIEYLIVVDVIEFQNRVTLKGQAVGVRTGIWVFDPELKLLGNLEADGASDATKVFAKKGGPEVNLNAALENNATATVRFLQDFLTGENQTA